MFPCYIAIANRCDFANHFFLRVDFLELLFPRKSSSVINFPQPGQSYLLTTCPGLGGMNAWSTTETGFPRNVAVVSFVPYVVAIMRVFPVDEGRGSSRSISTRSLPPLIFTSIFAFALSGTATSIPGSWSQSHRLVRPLRNPLLNC